MRLQVYFLFVLLLATTLGKAQNTPMFRQFLSNQYLFNPAFVASEDHVEISLAYKTQWQNFDGHPSSQALTFQYPIKNLRVGVLFSSHEAAYLKNNRALVTIAYRLRTSERSSLTFGLSTGAGSYKLDIDNALYSNDPTILSAAIRHSNWSGNSGVQFSNKWVELGFSFPEIFGADQLTRFQQFSQFRNQLYSVRFKIRGSNHIRIEPYFVYGVTGDFQNFWEISSKIDFHEHVWTGASFRQYTGLAFLAGARVAKFITLNYSYELAPTAKAFISTCGHEVHLSLWPDALSSKKIK